MNHLEVIPEFVHGLGVDPVLVPDACDEVVCDKLSETLGGEPGDGCPNLNLLFSTNVNVLDVPMRDEAVEAIWGSQCLSPSVEDVLTRIQDLFFEEPLLLRHVMGVIRRGIRRLIKEQM